MTNRSEYLAAVNRPGAYQAVRWESIVPRAKLAKGNKDKTATKKVTAVTRTGLNHANLAVNKDRETGALPWGEWAVHPYIITHKGADYGRLYVVDGTVKAVYYIDGVEVTQEQFQAILIPSAQKAERPSGGCITPKLESITLL